MGIRYLWNILTPFCERKPLYELQGKTVAVDLSCWVCEAQNISEYQVQPKMYLRNLYFRTSYLLLMEVYPIFVLEGKAPELKYETIKARNAIQFKGAKPKTDGVKTGKDRSRFHHVLKQCQEMLSHMGLACLTGKGEAESFCAFLNQEGFVHGCISQDSDCFAYGAQIVYRNFSISSQGSHAASGGAVDVYDIRKATESLGFGRKKIVALALLCGSDYSEGVQGVGKDCSMKFFEKYSDDEVLDRMRDWRKNLSVFEDFERKLADKNICTSCGHLGKIQAHNKSGCKSCGTSTGCDFSKYKDERMYIKNEVAIRSKALKDPNFPNEELIKEYLSCKDEILKVDLQWRQPDLVKFVNFTSKYLGWEEMYSFEKFLPILTRWQLLNIKNVESIEARKKLRGVLYPEKIKKTRAPKGVPSYEIIWKDEENFFTGLIPDCQLIEIKDMEKFWSTIEPQNLVDTSYPKLVEDFKNSKIKPKKATRRKINKKDPVDDLNASLGNISISEPTRKKPRKQAVNLKKLTTAVKQKQDKTKKIEDFFQTAVLNSFHKSNGMETSTPVKKGRNNLEYSDFDDDTDSDLSDILDGILSKKVPNCFKEKLSEMGYEICEDNKENCASFFANSLVENDLFERTFNIKYEISEESDLEDNDTFEIAELPLIERLKNKH